MERGSRISRSRVKALTRHGAFVFAAVAAGYALGYELASNWFSAEDQGASFFPAAGVTLAALVLVPRWQWVYVLGAAGATELTLDVVHGTDVAASIGYALANTVQPFVGATLLLAFTTRVDLRRTRDLAAFLGCAVIVAPLVGGAIAATNFVLVDGNSGWARFAFEWWSGDGLGVLVVGAAILSLPTTPRLPARRWIECWVGAALAVGATAVVFDLGWFEFVYVPVALLVVLAFRVGTTGVALTSALVAFVAAGATAEAQDFWQAIDVSPANRILYLQLALAVIVSAVLALAAEIAERERIAVDLARSESERAAAVERLVLYEAERTARERAELLERNAAHLAAAATVDEVATSTVDDLTTAGIPIVGVEALREDGERAFVSVLAVTGLPTELVSAFEDYPLEAHTPGAEAIRTGRPVEIASGGEYDRRFPGTAEYRRQRQSESVFAVPMRSAAGVIIGAVSGATPEPEWFDDARKALVTTIAEQTGLALERASLLEREREARARAELDEQLAVQLQQVTAALAAAETALDVAQVVVRQLVPTLGGMGGSVFVVDEDAAALRMVDFASYPEDVVDAYRELPLSRHTPPSDSIRAAEPILFADADAFHAAYPELAAEIGVGQPRLGRAWAHVPLFVGARAVGLLFVAYDHPQPFDRRQRDTLVSICEAVAQALRRAELYEAEREARLRAELLQSHAGRLAAAATVHDVAQTTIAGLEAAGISAAWVQILRGGKLQILDSAGVPEQNLARYRTYGLDTQTPPAEAARTGAVVEVATGAELDARFPDSAVGRRINPFESLVSMPLTDAAGRTLGVLTFTSFQPNWLNESRRRLALGLAEQCGLALERAALRGEADETAADAALLAHLGDVLERATGLSERAEALVRALVGDRSALAVVHALDEAGRPELLAEATRELELDAQRGRLDRLAAAALVEDGPTADESDAVHLHAVPLRARNRALGVLTIGVPAADASPLTTVMAQRVATRAALAFDNALLYEQERDVSHSLQMGLLGGALEEAPETVAATAYRPGTAMLEVGGDWYDRFALPDGRLALVVGDVVGHGLEAAVAMGQLRGAVRALAPVGSPSEVFERLDQLVDTLPQAAMATLAYALLDSETGALTYACAGHPPPLVVPADGEPRLLWQGRSAPLGSSLGGPRAEAVDALGAGDTIVLYTDGLVERRTDGVSAGLDRLVASVRGKEDAEPSELVASILEACLAGTRQEDDVCILAVRRAPSALRFEHALRASPAEVADMRRALSVWLEDVGLDPEQRRDAVLAVVEAAANAAEHAYGFDGIGVVRVEARITNGDLRVSVADQGTWREPSTDSVRGRGRTIMEALMGEVAIDAREGGTVVRMRVPTRRGAPV
jgi:serine/threonine-protein kinase RsbW